MIQNIRLLILSDIWPFPEHGAGAANVITYELIRALSQQEELSVGFLRVGRWDSQAEPNKLEQQGLDKLRQAGVAILPSVILPKPKKPRPKWIKVISPQISDFYPEITDCQTIERAFKNFSPRMLFIPLCEWLTAVCSPMAMAKFAYYGNPDPKCALSRINFDHNHKLINSLKYYFLRQMIAGFEKEHSRQMKKYEILGNVAANDVSFYQQNGHPNAFYIQNVWIDRFGSSWPEKRRELEKKEPAVIIGSIGNLNATANRYGLEYLGQQILPRLRDILKDRAYEVHILGPDKLSPFLNKLLTVPEVKIRGYVDDIDQEILMSQVFLSLNNATPYKVCHTRVLHAWSLGSCVVAHQDSRLSMPEILDGKNALLGSNPAEIADKIAGALFDPLLRQKIGEQGYQTFKTFFTAEKVAPKIIERIKNYFANNPKSL